MPLTRLPKSLYLHVLRTGGNWVTRTLYQSVKGIEGDVADAYQTHWGHAGIQQATDVGEDVSGKFTFLFVRHPVEWLRSYWRRRAMTNWHPVGGGEFPWFVFENHYSLTFQNFVRQVIDKKEHHGAVGRMFDWFTEIDGKRAVSYVGKYENLADDLVEALTLAGEDFNESALRGLPPQNISDREKFPAEWRGDQWEVLCEIEKAAIEKYGYG